MILYVALEQRFGQDEDGRVTTAGGFHYGFWQRYLAGFDHVVVVCRVRSRPCAEGAEVEGAGVEVLRVPDYSGLSDFARRMRAIVRTLDSHVVSAPDSALLLRAPSLLGMVVRRAPRFRRLPWAVELVGDPDEVFKPGAVDHPLRPLMRLVARRETRAIVKGATGVSYVTADRLQRAYPAPAGCLTATYSSVELAGGDFAEEPWRRPPEKGSGPRLALIGSLERPYKGADIAIDALATNPDHVGGARLTVVGDGRLRPSLEAEVRRLGLADRVRFTGQLPGGEAVRDVIDQSDVVLIPSRTEGLPRVALEAMARGRVCVTSTAGGLPEVTPTECLVEPLTGDRLARKIGDLWRNPSLMERLAQRNLRFTHETYAKPTLDAARSDFYQRLAKRFEDL